MSGTPRSAARKNPLFAHHDGHGSLLQGSRLKVCQRNSSSPAPKSSSSPASERHRFPPRTTVVAIHGSDIVEWSLVEHLLRSALPRTSTRPVVESLSDRGRVGLMPWISVMVVTMSTPVPKVVTDVPVPRAAVDTAPGAVGCAVKSHRCLKRGGHAPTAAGARRGTRGTGPRNGTGAPREREAPGHEGGPGRIRTCGTRFRRAVLYPLSYGAMGLTEVCPTPPPGQA